MGRQATHGGASSFSTFASPSFYQSLSSRFGYIFICAYVVSFSQLFETAPLQAFLLMQTSGEEDEKEVEEDSQRVSAEAIMRGLIEADSMDENIGTAQISVDEIEVDVSDDGEQGISKTIPASLLEEGNMKKLVLALDPPSPFAIYTSPESKKEIVCIEEAIVHYEDGPGQTDQRPGEKTKYDTDYETADEMGHELHELQHQKELEKQGNGRKHKEKDHPQKREQDHGFEVKISSADDTETRKTKTPVKSLIQKYNSIMKPSEDQNIKKVNLSRQGNDTKASGGNRKYKQRQGKEESKDRAPPQKKVKAEKNMSKVSLDLPR